MDRISRRQFDHWAATAAGVISLGGCAPWERADSDHGLDRLAVESLPPTPLEWRVLNRLGYGPRPGDLARLRAVGVDAWVDRQLHPESIDESPDLIAALAQLDSLELAPEEARDRETEWEADSALGPVVRKVLKLGKDRPTEPGPDLQQLAQATVLRAAFSER